MIVSKLIFHVLKDCDRSNVLKVVWGTTTEMLVPVRIHYINVCEESNCRIPEVVPCLSGTTAKNLHAERSCFSYVHQQCRERRDI